MPSEEASPGSPCIEVSALGKQRLSIARQRLADGSFLVAIRPLDGLDQVHHSTSAVDYEAWPDIAIDGFVVAGKGGGWRLSSAPLPNFDLFVALDEQGGACLSDSAAALASPEQDILELAGLASRFSGSVTLEGTGTIRRGVHRIAGGVELHIVDGELIWRRWWRPSQITIQRRAELNRCAESLRHLAEESIKRCLPSKGPVAVHLSGGRDSSLACALAAQRLGREGRRVFALTALPCAGLPECEGDYQFDESAAATEGAKRFANVDHHQLRPSQIPLTVILDQIHANLGEPIHQPVSLGWAWPILQACGARKVTTLLTGGSGNFTVSAGGLHYLADLWREEGAGSWLRTIARITFRERNSSARDLVRASFGGVLPRRLYDLGRRKGQPPAFADDYPFLRGGLRTRLLELTGLDDDPRPHPSFRAFVQGVAAENYNLLPVGRLPFGVEYSSPWDSRALFEFLLSMPASLLASGPDRRLLYDRAFGDLLPMQVLRPTRRGRQNVDFHAAFDPADIAEGIARYASSPLCREMVDTDALARQAKSWPKERNTSVLHFDRWVGQFLPSLALASFLYSHERRAPPAAASASRPQFLHAPL